MTTAKSAAFIGLWLKDCYLVGEGGDWFLVGREGGDKNLVVGGVHWGVVGGIIKWENHVASLSLCILNLVP